MKHAKNTICLWFNGGAEAAARFYAETFPDSSVGKILRAPGDFPSGKKGDVLTVQFTVLGILPRAQRQARLYPQRGVFLSGCHLRSGGDRSLLERHSRQRRRRERLWLV